MPAQKYFVWFYNLMYNLKGKFMDSNINANLSTKSAPSFGHMEF